MTTDPRDPKGDNMLEQDLESVRTAWAEQKKVEPPDLLNRAVLNQAKRELGNQGVQRRKWFSLNRLGAFATASVIVVGLALVIQQDNQAPIQSTNETDSFRLDSDEESADLGSPQIKAKSENVMREAPSKRVLQDSAALSDRTPEPEAWITKLLSLKEAQSENLASELAAFRATYPDYPLPADLDD
jgi:hypothetical protein